MKQKLWIEYSIVVIILTIIKVKMNKIDIYKVILKNLK